VCVERNSCKERTFLLSSCALSLLLNNSSICINPQFFLSLSRLFFKKKIVLSAINILSNFHPNQRHLNSVHILRTHFYLKSFNIIDEFNFGFNKKFSYSFHVLPPWLSSMSQHSLLTVKYNNKSNVKSILLNHHDFRIIHNPSFSRSLTT